MNNFYSKTKIFVKLFKRYNYFSNNDLLIKCSTFETRNQCEYQSIRCFAKSPQIDSSDNYVDIAIFGGGIMGSSVAYWLSQRHPNRYSCAVIERDSTYSMCSTTRSAGGIRQQFSTRENIEISLFSSHFLQNISNHLSVSDKDLPDINLNLNGYLVVATDAGAQQLMDNHKLQIQLGAKMELMSAEKLKAKFPWINTKDIVLANYGLQNEGYFDPWALLMAFKTKAQSLGVKYINSEIIGFDLRSSGQTESTGYEIQTCNEVMFKQSNGNINRLRFGTGIVTCGPYSGLISKYLGYGSEATGVRSKELAVEPRKRYVFVVHCPDGGPGANGPMVIDFRSRIYFRPDGKGGNYLVSRSPLESEEPAIDDLEVDYEYFDTNVWPHLMERVPAFESLKLRKSWAGFYDYHRLDQNPVIGRDPYYHNIYWATGFSGHGIQKGPAVGRALMELIFDNSYKTIDLSRFGWERVLKNEPFMELNAF